MPTGDITATTTEHPTMANLNATLTTYTSGAATAGADTTTFLITTAGNGKMFYLTRLVRLA